VARVLKRRYIELLTTVFIAINLLVISSLGMYYLEVRAIHSLYAEILDEKRVSVPSLLRVLQSLEDVDSPLDSLAMAALWSVTALTTVSFAEVAPASTQGKVFGSIVAFLGVGIFALPAGIIGSGFMEVMAAPEQSL